MPMAIVDSLSDASLQFIGNCKPWVLSKWYRPACRKKTSLIIDNDFAISEIAWNSDLEYTFFLFVKDNQILTYQSSPENTPKPKNNQL